MNYARCVILTILLYTVGAIGNDTVLYSIILKIVKRTNLMLSSYHIKDKEDKRKCLEVMVDIY